MKMRNTGLIIIKFISAVSIAVSISGCGLKHTEKETDKTKLVIQKETEPTHNQVETNKKNQNKAWVPLTDDNLKKELKVYGSENHESLVLLKTPKGTMKIKLYKNTPIHRANFIRLIKNKFYSGTVFYRVINYFMIQGGDSDDWSRQSIKSKMGNYTIPAEINADNIHQKGALSMAREYENNPDKRSVPFEFFIVQGVTYTKEELAALEKQYRITISPEHKKIYETVGGCPHLDGQHTVFGQIIEGLSVIDSIAAVPVDKSNWPINDVSISFQILQ